MSPTTDQWDYLALIGAGGFLVLLGILAVLTVLSKFDREDVPE